MHRCIPFFAICLLTSFACSPATETNTEPPPPPGHLVEIVTTAMQFEGPSEIPSGWTTFRFINNSPMIHFAIVERLPEGKTLQDQQDEIAPVFQNIMDNINGKPLSAQDMGFELPEWFGGIVFLGGPGMISPGKTAEATMYLEPGTYLVECYIKTTGVFHSYNPSPEFNGMVHQIEVLEQASEGVEPEPTVQINLSSDQGIQWSGDIPPGAHTIAVKYLDQKLYENFLGHDVHLFRVHDTTDLRGVAAWMDWSQPAGLETPTPAEFLGGIHEMPAGQTGYFHVQLDPGRYAFIAEVPKADSIGMLKTFEVAGGE
ncbi:MAG: hypothetical protein R3301_05495 [Saprospiraceae bacterium]|nr:hypothetical protein [Saprospiraceae bacterium]